MKHRIVYKSPDAIYDAVSNLSGDEREDEIEAILSVLGSTEYLTVEVDTEARTVRVIRER